MASNQILKPCFAALFLIMASLSSGQPYLLAVVNTDQAKLRSCSGLDCPVIGVLRAGQQCEILRTERLEEIGGYGINTWVEALVNNKSGFVYGALLRLVPQERNLIRLQKTAFSSESRANVRTCPDRMCDILFQLPEGSLFQVLGQTDFTDRIAGQGEGYHWYLIEYQGKTGFIHGSVLAFNENTGNALAIQAEKAEVYNVCSEEREAIASVSRGQVFPVLRQSDASELIRPYGRYYWYLIDLGQGQLGWVYGAFTSKAGAPVDCQCVDFVKHALDVSGPTRNAFEWHEVLLGQVQVDIGGAPGYLRYRQVVPPEQAREGDIAVFGKAHPEAHPDYGHIGFVARLATSPDGYLRHVEIEGGNHQVPIEDYYVDKRCNNVSKKWYSVDQNVRFYRLN
ncbi:MAG: SH3 domain-containing protein [Phaeodactylibacter sp.]|nr:SH3 domain-containing protein [Phaeodactylibacter sp.]